MQHFCRLLRAITKLQHPQATVKDAASMKKNVPSQTAEMLRRSEIKRARTYAKTTCVFRVPTVCGCVVFALS